MTNLEIACRAFGWHGGTIHQVAEEMGLPGQGPSIALMGEFDFRALLKKTVAPQPNLEGE